MFIEISFIEHCDDPSCSLGSLEVLCPYCETEFTDYDNWFKFEGSKILEFRCDHCKKKFKAQYTFGEWELV